MMRRGQGRLKHLSIRHLWAQGLVKLGMVEIIKIDTKNNPADLNTKSLSVQRRRFLMSLMNMWCDGNEMSFTAQVPGHDELAGVVARVILALSSLPMTKGMSTDFVEKRDSHYSDLWWMKLASMVAMICLSLLMLVWMNPGRRLRDSDSPQPEEEEDEAFEVQVPPGSDEQRMVYLARVAEMFYVTMTGQHDEYEVRRRFRGGEIPSDAVHETLYQLQLLTQALMDGHYQVAAEMMELANMDDVSERQILTVIRRLKDTYIDTARGSFNDIGNWLYTKHGGYLRSVGRDLSELEDRLGIVHAEPDAEEFFDEEEQERVNRYLNTPDMGECSDPELWMRLHHLSDSDES